MKFKVFIIALVFGISCNTEQISFNRHISHYDSIDIIENNELPYGIRLLLECYPEHFTGGTLNSIVWNDYTETIFNDGIAYKDFSGLVNNPDLEDQLFSMSYFDEYYPPPKNHDPGRVRVQDFFMKMYGNSKKEVERNLVEITWLPKHCKKKLKVTKVNNVAFKLQQISNELDKHPELYKYIENPGGTFNWRHISGTERLSPHSFGIAIDIVIKYSNYWQWDYKSWETRGEDIDIEYRNKIPEEIVAIFEKHGFIWGGKWYHYDTMHFEYRPELLYKE